MFVCSCYAVRKADIERAVQEEGCATVKEVQDLTLAGTCCGSCCDDVEDIVGTLVPAGEAGRSRAPRKLA
jgi:NAD(P)H-nitrite reductase large subunit